MTKRKLSAPDEAIKDLFYIGEDGFFYYYDTPENKRRTCKYGFKVGGNSKKCYPAISYSGKSYKVHHLMWWVKTGEWIECDENELDHINHDILDYRFDNLRKVTKQENQINKIGSYNISAKQYKNGSITYVTRISISGKTFCIGCYPDEATALYAAWKIRDILYPGILAMPAKLVEVMQ